MTHRMKNLAPQEKTDIERALKDKKYIPCFYDLHYYIIYECTLHTLLK